MTQSTNQLTISTLGEVANLQKGMTITAKSALAGSIPVIAGGKKPAYFHAEANRPSKTITVSASGAYAGYVAFHGEPIWASDCITAFPTNLQICTPEFLYYFMLSKQNEIYGLQRGSGMPHVYAKDLALLEIVIPPLDEQRRSVKTLEDHMSRLDKALADLDHADSQTLVFRRSILNALLNPYASNSQKDIERATIPAGWQTSSLGVLADVLDNKRIPLSAAERKHREGPVPYYGATGQVGTIDKPLFDEPLVLLGEDGVQFFDPYKPKAYKIAGPSWVNNHAHVLRPKAEVIEFGYLLHYLNAFDYQGYANGTTRLKLTQGAMNSIPVHMPPLEEQRRIVETLDDHLSRIDSTRKSIANLKAGLAALRRSLLNKAYNGQLGTK